MQSQERRDEKTVQIFTALLVFVAVAGGGGSCSVSRTHCSASTSALRAR